MDDRFTKQADFVPRDCARECAAFVVGVGAIGRQVCLQLASIGVSRLTLVDDDRVDETNVTTQGYLRSDVGVLKVEAVARSVAAIDDTIDVVPIAGRFGPNNATERTILSSAHARCVHRALFCCVDSIETRKSLWYRLGRRFPFWVDGRMQGEVIRVLAADESHTGYYPRTLFAGIEAAPGRCTAHSTVYAASIAAGLMVHQLTRWFRRVPVDKDISLNLLSGDWVVVDSDVRTVSGISGMATASVAG